jgi:glycerophosphoryl diester phosphodiesterase
MRQLPQVVRALLSLMLLMVGNGASAMDLQGHRGARGLYPENTLPAFAYALALGVGTLELDVGMTRDGVVVVSHDSTLNPDITRTAEGRWISEEEQIPINSLEYAALERYDVGAINPASAYARRFPQQKAMKGVRIPRLDEVFALVLDSDVPDVRFNIETKISPERPGDTPDVMRFTRALINAVRKNGLSARTTIQSFDWRTLRIVQQAAPEIATSYLTAQRPWMDNIRAGNPPSPWAAGFQWQDHRQSVWRMVKAAGGSIWSPYHGDLTLEDLQAAKAAGLRVIVWTVNDENDMRRLMTWGVDGIISDFPDRLLATYQVWRDGKNTGIPR